MDSELLIFKKYAADYAIRKHEKRNQNKGPVPKLLKDPQLRNYIQEQILCGKSPYVVIGRMKVEGKRFQYSVSTKTVYPGGLISIGTGLDPSITKSDGLTGRMVGRPGELPSVVHEFKMRTTLLDRVVGTASDLKVDEIKTNEPLMLSIGTATTVGVVKSARGGSAEVTLKIPVCIIDGQRVAISRRISGKWRLIGYGIVEN